MPYFIMLFTLFWLNDSGTEPKLVHTLLKYCLLRTSTAAIILTMHLHVYTLDECQASFDLYDTSRARRKRQNAK